MQVHTGLTCICRDKTLVQTCTPSMKIKLLVNNDSSVLMNMNVAGSCGLERSLRRAVVRDKN